MLDQQIDRLDRTARRSLEAFAVLRPIPLAALAAVLDRPALAVADDLRAAAELRLVVAEDDRSRPATTSSPRPSSTPSRPGRVALHRARLGHAGSRRRPLPAAAPRPGRRPELDARTVGLAQRDAGVAAYERRALDEALDLLDTAAAALPGDPVLVVHRGLVLAALGRLEEADEVLDEAVATALGLDGTDPALLVRAAVGDEPLGKTVSGDPRRLARLHRVEAPDAARRRRGSSCWSRCCGRSRSSGTRARPSWRRCAGSPRRPGTSVTVRARARALEVRQLVEGPEPAARRLALAAEGLELARRAGDPTVVLDATELLMTAALGAGDVERALALRETLAVQARRWHRPRLIWASRVLEAALALARGEFDEADTAALACLQLGQELGVGDALPAFGVHLMIRNWMAGTADTSGTWRSKPPRQSRARGVGGGRGGGAGAGRPGVRGGRVAGRVPGAAGGDLEPAVRPAGAVHGVLRGVDAARCRDRAAGAPGAARRP